MDDTKDDSPAWSPPAHDPATGIAMIGDYPLNHRLRAERLAEEDKATDPDGIITDALIADTSARLKAEAKSAPKPLDRMTRAELVEVAELERVPHETDANKAAILTAILDARAAPTAPAIITEG